MNCHPVQIFVDIHCHFDQQQWNIDTKMKKYKVLGDLGTVIKALDEIDQDKLLKTGVNEIINIHMKILKNQQRELKNLTKELKKEVKSPNKKVICT